MCLLCSRQRSSRSGCSSAAVIRACRPTSPSSFPPSRIRRGEACLFVRSRRHVCLCESDGSQRGRRVTCMFAPEASERFAQCSGAAAQRSRSSPMLSRPDPPERTRRCGCRAQLVGVGFFVCVPAIQASPREMHACSPLARLATWNMSHAPCAMRLCTEHPMQSHHGSLLAMTPFHAGRWLRHFRRQSACGKDGSTWQNKDGMISEVRCC